MDEGLADASTGGHGEQHLRRGYGERYDYGEHHNHDIHDDQILPGKTHSLWLDTTPDTNFPVQEKDIEVDTVIVGGGIVGITCAVFLKEAGQTVALVEMRKIIKGATGHTTAKITSMQGLKYQKLLKAFPLKQARIYAEANQAAIEKIADLVNQKYIDCDFMRTSSYTYTELQKNLNAIKNEEEAANRLGLPVAFTKDIPLPFDIKGAIRLDNQAQFHPRKYLLALANEIPGDGSYIFENTRAFKVEDGDPCVVTTAKGEIKAKNIILATAFPFYDTGLFAAKLYPHYAYAIGMYIESSVPKGIYYSEDDIHHSLRNQPTRDGLLLIVGGGYHKTGQGGDTLKQYKAIEEYARDRFNLELINSYWSTEDYDTPDEAPYIGKAPKSKHVYMAAGFGGWGMTNGTIAAMVIADEILDRQNPWSTFFNPSRHEPATYGRKFLIEGINIAEQYTKGLFLRPEKANPSKLSNGEGAIVKADGKKIAAYRDDKGKLYTVSSICTHLGCPVNWNNAEQTWDCTCHGSRFNINGEVIHGPATGDLPEEKAY
ncbi:MAG: FAD-dependent oxidoreductase [Actinomycetota bacterium]|nr:FAD-dependent oxidoreductase [Actinomycetota bacterium]